MMTNTLAEQLATWLLGQIARDEQSARAMPHAIEGLQARWSPSRLIADCEAKRKIVQNCLATIQAFPEPPIRLATGLAEQTLRLMANPLAHLPGYREEWRP